MTEGRILDLDLFSLGIVQSILHRHIPDRPVFAFGSRTRGRARRRSDLDLAIGGTEPVARRTINDIKEDFSESDLSIFVDVLDIHSIDPGFLHRIERDFVPVPQSAISD